MSAKLTFLETTNLDGFKRLMNCTTVNVIKNPKKEGSHFITIDSDESFRGSAPKDLSILGDNPAFSLVEGDAGKFWMIHKRQSSNIAMSF